ncbi:MAG TPA: hypothetical protein DCW90_13820 [Lachnospiraceae bacterium]|nr:hypothetical protein [Lachnospiraceae bacterium]
MSKFNVGDKVVFINALRRKEINGFYPKVGAIGTIKEIDEKSLLVDWGEAKDVTTYIDGTKSWWCAESDVKSYSREEINYTDDEVWTMLKPKMNQFALPNQNINNLSQEIKNMIVAAYRSGYGRATKGRLFMIQRKCEEKPSITKAIDAVLNGKMLVTFYDTDDSYAVSNFEHSAEGREGIEIHNKPIYDSGECGLFSGYDVIGEPDCEIYVAVPLGDFPVHRGDKFVNMSNLLSNVGETFMKPYQILKYISNEDWRTYCFSSDSFYNGEEMFIIRNEDNRAKLRVLVPIRDYLKKNGVNV